MAHNLVLTVRLHSGRYHGARDWPPSAGRLFQALVAGAAIGASLKEESAEALNWLEGLAPPTIGSPSGVAGQRVQTFVPDNDIDAVGGDFQKAGDIRSPKAIQPQLFDSEIPFLYIWSFQEGTDGSHSAQMISTIAERLYQFGRGVDMAWAVGDVLDDNQLEARLATYPGRIYRPSGGGDGTALACPVAGSLASLNVRYAAGSTRFTSERQGNARRQSFSQPPKSRFAQVPYESPPSFRVYDLREATKEASFWPWPLARASALVVQVRDEAVRKLRRALPDQSSEIERVLIGRKVDGGDDGPTAARVRIVPLASIGHPHADRRIRKVLVEVPAGCPLRADDVHWAFSGLDVCDTQTGEVSCTLTPSEDHDMLGHFGVENQTGFNLWRTVTPVALPESARRRRIEPARRAAEAKGGAERAVEQTRAVAAVIQSLRHADVRAGAQTIRLQREPFEGRGARVEEFAAGTRFAKERLWHVEVQFDRPLRGSLVIGDGRFLGLGVMAPVKRAKGIHAFVIEHGLSSAPEPREVARAVRRAVMARVQAEIGRDTALSSFFTGHVSDGSPARAETQPHLSFLFDREGGRVLIVAPHVCDRRAPSRDDADNLAILGEALSGFSDLRAGSAGRLTLSATDFDLESDPLSGPSTVWESVTPYEVNRHAKKVGAVEALAVDLGVECRRRGLPEPVVDVLDVRGLTGVGLTGRARLTFRVAVAGPMVLGRSRHLGGGLFARAGR